jgi:hypothetical protein
VSTTPPHSVADPEPGSGAFLTLGSGIRDEQPGFPDHISECLEKMFWVKILKFLNADPGSGMEKSWIRDKHPGSAILAFAVNL